MRFYIVFVLISILVPAYGQTDYEKHKSTAHQLFSQGQYKEALVHYEIGYSHPDYRDNYGTFDAAMAACQVGDTSRALYFLHLSAQVGYDYANEQHFLHNPLNSCLKSTNAWHIYAKRFQYLADSAKAEEARLKSEISKTLYSGIQKTTLNDTTYLRELADRISTKRLISLLKTFDDFPETAVSGCWVKYEIPASDTLTVPYLVYIPKTYVPQKAFPLYIYLHGAIVNRTAFADVFSTITGPETALMTTATQEEAIILFPLGKKEWGWLYHQEAFETIMRQIAEVKSRYNINDNKIYLGGHSNGGTGAFWFANKKPSAFAGFFAYNFLPVLYSSNTHLNNLLWGPPLYGMHGLRDKTFPATETSQIHLLAQRNGAVWHSTYLQEGHSLPFSGNDSTRALFDSVKFHSRTPFREKLFRETDDVRNGRNHWIETSELDTTSARAPWHIDLIPEIISSKKYQKYPFNRNKTGAIRASLAERNVVHLESSRVKKAKLYFSEDMFDFSKRVKIYHEGVLIFNSKIRANKNTILSEFLKTYDRSYIVSHILEIELAGI